MSSPYFLAVKAAHIVKLVWEQERLNRTVTLDDMRMFRIRAHEVATMAEMAEGPVAGKRDDNPADDCPDFERSTDGRSDSSCDSDGHYACLECKHVDVEQYRILKNGRP